MKHLHLLIISLLLLCHQAFAQADCSTAIIIAGNTQAYNPSGVGSKLETLACGGIEHNSTWLAFQAKASGKLNFIIRSYTIDGLPTTADFDWSLYLLTGPPGAGTCNTRTQLSCNFAGTSTVFGIPGSTGMATPNYTATAMNPGIDVTSGNWYLLLVDQFSNTTPLMFSVQFTGNPETNAINSTPGIFDDRPDFTINTSSACTGTYVFNSTSVAASGIVSYLWNFGDGSTSTATNPSHTYVTTGTYYVSLRVTDANGFQTTIRKAVVYNNSAPVMSSAGILLLPSCTDGNNGSITVTTTGVATPGVTGGVPPYTFELVSPSAMIRGPQASGLFTGLQPGSYTIKATDLCGKSATITSTVTQIATNSTIGLGIQNIQSSCASTPTGSATIFANGTQPPYTMSLVNSSPVTQGPFTAVQRDPITSTYFVTFNNLLPGVYTVEATDACGKIRRATFTVTASTLPTVAVVNTASCAGTATGTLNVTPTAGTGLATSGSPGTFQYALIAPSVVTRPFQSSSVFENLPPGTYTVAVRDICGNTGTTTSTIATAVAPTLGATFTTISCPNGATGTLEAQVSAVGGGTPFAFELAAPSTVVRPQQASNTFTGLPPGAYTLKLTDGCGNSVSGNVTINAATAPSFTTTIAGSCLSSSSGAITVAPAASSIGPFTFELISPGAAIRSPQASNIANTTSSIFTGLDQGAYTIRMTDGCGTPVTNAVSVSAPTALAFPAGSTTIPSCSASSTGQITVAVPTTGLGAYKYELIAPSPVTRPPQYSRVFNSLPVGSYTVRITDSCGTQVTIGSPLSIAAAAAPTLSVTNTASCATASGTINVLAGTGNQGGGTYMFALIAPSAVTMPDQASPIFTGLPAGSYTVQITDQCGVTATTTTTIAAAGAFTPAAGGSVVSCNGSSYAGQIIVTNPQNYTPGGPIPTGSGGGPYLYALYDATNTIQLAGLQTSNIFTNVVPVAGNPSHTIRVVDACGNTSTATLALNPPTALGNPTLSVVASSCAAGSNGVLRITTVASGGLTPYTYTLIDANTSAVVAGPQSAVIFNGVPPNATGYLVRTADACGNTITTSVPVLFPAAVAPTATVTTVASCASGTTGSITVAPGTGTTVAGGAYTYALYDAGNTVLVAATQASPVFSGIAPGTYTVRITDQCGTVGTAAATVTSSVTALTAAGTATGTCSSGSTGVISASATGGSLPLSYSLLSQPSGTVIAGPQAGTIFTGLAAGTYAVRVTDACGTVVNSADIVLANLSATPTLTTSSATDCSGSVTLGAYGASGNGGPYTYAICNGSGCTSFGAYSTSSLFTITTNGTYRIAVLDKCGNQALSADIVVTIPTKAVITGITKANAIGPTTITPTFTNVPNTPYFSIDGGNFSPSLTTYNPGCHTLRVTDYNSGTFGCASDAYNFSVYNPATLTTASPANWSSACGTSVTPSLVPATGTTGCGGSGASFGIKLTACTGCTAAADPVGTVKAVGVPFSLPGAGSASFVPVIVEGGSDIGSGSTVTANFTAAPFNCFLLPAGLLSFAGEREGAVNKLHWTTSSEFNNKGFMVQRSVDGLNYSDLGFVNTRATGGNSNDALTYQFTDYTPAGTKQYYRLRQEDLDGRKKLSQVVLIKGSHATMLAVTGIMPNPASSEINVLLDVPVKDRITILIIDATGKTVVQKSAEAETGSNAIPVSVGHLPNGPYLVKLVCSSNCESAAGKFIKQ